MDIRIPVHLEVSGLIRRVERAGGFATVLHKGEPDAGSLLLVLCSSGEGQKAWERAPHFSGTKAWACVRDESECGKAAFADYLVRRAEQDPDLWILELDIVQAERFIQ